MGSKDKTKKHSLDEKLRMLAMAVEQSMDGIAVAGVDGNIKFANLKWAKMHGYKVSELIGKHLSIFHTKEQMKKDVIPFNKQVWEIGAHHGEVGHVKKNGTIFQAWMATTLLKDEKGKPIGLVGIARDITKRKKAEREILLAKERLNYLLSSTTAVIYAAKTSGDYGATFISDNVFYVSGYKPQEFIKSSSFWIKHVHPDDRQRVLKEVTRIFKERVYSYEYRFLCKNGKYIWMRDEMKCVRDNKGRPIEIVGYWKDVTEHKKLEENLKKLNKELLKSNEKLKQLVLKDSQTGLYNHHYLPEAIKAEFYRAKRYVHPFSLIMLDIDYFKSINDVYGHKFGDLVLKQVAKQLIKDVRRYDVIIRFGGEEFVVVSPGTDRYAALILARRILDSVNLYNFGNKKHSIKLTFSIAVVSYPEDKVAKYMGLVDLADQILNKVKEDGGDRVYSSMDIKKKKKKTSVVKEESAEVKFLKNRLEKLTKKSKQSLIESIFAFAKTIELKDHYTGEHVEKTVHYAAEIARALDLSEADIMRVRQAAVLHDLGKVGISEKILLKKSKLEKKEFAEIMKHPQIGTDIIRPIKMLHDIIPMILYHHENWNGKGYPAGLKGEDIPIGARIIALSDVYQALVSDRPYRKAYPKRKVIKIIKGLSGIKFDPKIVKVFLKILKEEIK